MKRTVRSRLKASVAIAAIFALLAASAGPRERILRFLCGPGRCEIVQQILQGRHCPERSTDCHHDGE